MRTMLRNVTSALFGYIVMFTVAFVLFFLMWSFLGSDRALVPDSWEVSGAWITGSIVLGMFVSIAGGLTTATLGADRTAVWVLAGLVLVFGAIALVPDTAEVQRRPEIVSMFDAMVSARQPRWLLALNPVLGVVGVLIGARLARRTKGAAD